jgi:hypothetical protein
MVDDAQRGARGCRRSANPVPTATREGGLIAAMGRLSQMFGCVLIKSATP